MFATYLYPECCVVLRADLTARLTERASTSTPAMEVMMSCIVKRIDDGTVWLAWV